MSASLLKAGGRLISRSAMGDDTNQLSSSTRLGFMLLLALAFLLLSLLWSLLVVDVTALPWPARCPRALAFLFHARVIGLLPKFGLLRMAPVQFLLGFEFTLGFGFGFGLALGVGLRKMTPVQLRDV